MSKEDPIRWAMVDEVEAYLKRSASEREARREYYRRKRSFDLQHRSGMLDRDTPLSQPCESAIQRLKRIGVVK